MDNNEDAIVSFILSTNKKLNGVEVMASILSNELGESLLIIRKIVQDKYKNSTQEQKLLSHNWSSYATTILKMNKSTADKYIAYYQFCIKYPIFLRCSIGYSRIVSNITALEEYFRLNLGVAVVWINNGLKKD